MPDLIPLPHDKETFTNVNLCRLLSDAFRFQRALSLRQQDGGKVEVWFMNRDDCLIHRYTFQLDGVFVDMWSCVDDDGMLWERKFARYRDTLDVVIDDLLQYEGW